ncbi:MAG: Hsp20 family protein [Candidatus Lokiarchaeota archaeon]|nr:Hsp20 family protein [Candidatus Lokiarchaeota archaeon]MBD3199270.1 Hsp20 family protein [Candidatus Lokiarchaeota archaeon]
MTESIKSEEKPSVEKVEENKPRKRVFTPEFCSYTNEEGNGYLMEIELPGVDKDDILLKMNDENIFITGETDVIRYIGSYALCCPIEPKEARAIYKNGLLKIQAPFKEIELNTIDINVE